MMDPQTIYIASSIDNNYAMSFASMIASVIDNLSPGHLLECFVMEDGVSDENKKRILASFDQKPVVFHWLHPDKEKLIGMTPKRHYSLAASYKILIFNLLPDIIEKIIFLDADLIVLKDLTRLWHTDIGDKVCWAVQDMSIPYIDAKRGSKEFKRYAPYVETSIPIINYEKFKINPLAKYFNSGVMLINVQKWREKKVEEQIIKFFINVQAQNEYPDQNGLNGILFDQWGELDPRWNRISHFFRYPGYNKSPFSKEIFEQIKSDPYIIHFVSASKPWYWGNFPVGTKLFFKYLDKTCWKGTRPRISVRAIKNKITYWLWRIKNKRFYA